MKRHSGLVLLASLWFCAPSMAWMADPVSADVAAIESQYSAGEYQAVFDQIGLDASPELIELKLQSLIKLERNDEAEALFAEWLLKHPAKDDALKAKQYLVGGNLYAILAQNSSMFSAPSLAGKSLEHYQQAQKYAPKDLEVARALFNYYLYAPGIVGGDEAKAREVAVAMGQFAPLEGQQGLLEIHLKNEDFAAFDAQFAEARKAFPNDRTLSLQQARRFEEAHAEAITALEAALMMTKPANESPEVESQLAYQLIKHAAKGKQGAAKALKLSEGRLDNLPKMFKGWVELRKAELYLQLGNKDEAKQWLANAEAVTPARDGKNFAKQIKALKKQL